MVDCVSGGEMLRSIERVEEKKKRKGGESRAGFSLGESSHVCAHMCLYPSSTRRFPCVFLCLHKSCFHSTQPDHDSFFLCESSPFCGTRFAVSSDDFLHVCAPVYERK